ncbi:hypothetical protein INT47_000061 [Mucor saturninus]|uniref:TLC domain-containing protein n=1 Tax=Mucor saturninus TaxID=64648 RepID=A0A8H7V9V8_9FUNG|nr:hypothetical protein INT47_000061 [Mucor saturninus]
MLGKLTLAQVFCQPIVPISFVVSFSSLICFFFYCIKSGFTKTDKQISWILTFASSLVCTITSIPFFLLFWRSGWDMTQLGTDSNYHTALVCFFISYLILDLSLGSIYYRNRITLLTGWIHHPLYIGILIWLLRSKSSSFFSTNCLLELPTLVLALGSFREKWRCDILFASSFFLLRLVFHAYMIVALKQRHRLETLWLVAVIVFPLHLYWFYGIVTQQVKRYATHWPVFCKTTPAIITRRRPKHSFLDRICTV